MENQNPPSEIISNSIPVSTQPAAAVRYILPISILLAAIIIGGSFVAGVMIYSKALTNAGGKPAPAIAVDIKDVNIKGRPFIGNEKAPVTMAYYYDYQCSYCAKFDIETLPEIVKKYVDTGKVKVVFKDFPFLGPNSVVAAETSHAVWELYPQHYFKWHQAMYRNLDAEKGAFGDEISVKKLTGTIAGIDANKVFALIAQKKEQYTSDIKADREEGSGFGIQGTPSFIIGKSLIPGALPLSSFVQLIDIELK